MKENSIAISYIERLSYWLRTYQDQMYAISMALANGAVLHIIYYSIAKHINYFNFILLSTIL